MSGHSKWATIKRAKGATDAKKGAMFTKLSRNISMAAKKGKDPEFNSSLRTAIDAAKAVSMPKDNIEKAILRGAGELPGQQIEEMVYEGYGPSGVAMMIRCATDNTNRTSSNLKAHLSKHGGKLGVPGSAKFLFNPDYSPLTTITLNEEIKTQFIKLLEELDNDDDVVDVHHNAAL